ncbi:paired amphipathic helix protein Sin3a-like isoform X2 [Clavelina lepadiformis]|uniref:paired amphipathic helix protein Sin3a-like isoform X2 n=1 Tax=Clavelina lepadiformis TaxID=159417 RepID=UPI004042208B
MSHFLALHFAVNVGKMSDKVQDESRLTSQNMHLYSTHQPVVSGSSSVGPSHSSFPESSLEVSSSTPSSVSFTPRPKPRFPVAPLIDPSTALAPLSAAAVQQTTTNTHAFASTSVASATQVSQRQATGITQVLAAGLISHGQTMQATSQMQAQQQQQQFQKLKVEDALSYLDQVKYQFGNQPQVYNDFLDIMKEFKSQSIDTPGVIARVSHLFNGHPDLIVGFNTFLPPGYKIEVSANDQVSVTGPNMISQTILPLGTLLDQGQQSTTIQVHTPHGKFATTLPQLPIHRSSPGPDPQSVAQSIPSTVFSATQPSGNILMTSTSHGPNTNTAVSSHIAGSLLSQPQSTGSGGQPVEFNHAINYVNKIKNRFQGQPDIYKAFLEILHKYQKEQRNVKDSNGAYTPSLSESEVYAQVARLFQNDEDLLREFGQFLPDAGGAVGASMNVGHTSSSPSSSVKTDSVVNDHSSTTKKTLSHQSAKPHRSSSHQSIKRAGQTPHLSASKRVKSCSLKDVSLMEASKHGTLGEFAFFDKVRRALQSQDAYDNFLRCLLLYNNEVVGKAELVQLVQPFLMKFSELFMWFKQFLGYKDGALAEIENEIITPQQQPLKEKHEGMAMEIGGKYAINYTTLKRLGSSYRALPPTFQQPKCTGRDGLCQEVLNDTWVSFPSWSEDSQFVTSKKTPFEEHIYRCEDERFELDVVIETNLGTIRALEGINKKLSRMSDEDKAKFRLDNYLGGTSEVTQRKAIHRIYGDKAPDIIDGLKKNPAVAVPLVLKRLKMKDDEWRDAQHQFNKVWRNQNEKYYLKSLDHQGISFKANDTRFLRSKSLINEIETLYDERQEAIENGSSVVSTGPQISHTYEDKSVMDDAASLIIHHVKRQSAIHKDDKQKVRQMMYQVLPDLYFAPRGNQPSDDDDEDDDDESDSENHKEKTNNKKIHHKVLGGYSTDDNLDGHYHLFFGNNNFYLFFRLHHILCERLLNIYRRAEILAEEDIKEKKDKKGETVAKMLRLRQINDVEVEDYYPAFLDMVRNLLDGNVDCAQYEDTLREMFTIHAYTTFTMDRLVLNIVRQLQHIVQDDTCVQLLELYQNEEQNLSTGGAIVSQARRLNMESSYQRKAEHLTTEENCFKITICQKQNHLHVSLELLDTDEEHGIDVVEVAKWSEYLEHYVSSDEVQITPQMKERLSEKPVFLQRNANHLRQVAKNSDEDYQNLLIQSTLECKVQTGSYKMAFVPGTEDIFYRPTCFNAARNAQNRVSKKCNEKFTSWQTKWEQENVSRDMARQTSNWLVGKIPGLFPHNTVVNTKKTGIFSRNFYRVHLTEAND